jgi:hypothetical protein
MKDIIKLKVGMKVYKNPETWKKNDFDNWGRGIGVGEVLEIFEDGTLDVRWSAGKCYENFKELSFEEISNKDSILQSISELKEITNEINNLDEYDDYNQIGLGSIKEEMIRNLKKKILNSSLKETDYLKKILNFLNDEKKTIDNIFPINQFQEFINKSELLPLETGEREYIKILKTLLEKYKVLYDIKDEQKQDLIYINEIEPLLNVINHNEDYLNKILVEHSFDLNLKENNIEKSNNDFIIN